MYFKHSQVFNKWINCGQREKLRRFFDSQLKTVRNSEWNRGSKDAPFSDLQNEYMVWYVPMNYMEVMTNITKFPKMKKKKKKGGGVCGRSVRDFSVCVHLNQLRGLLLRSFPFPKERPLCISFDYYYYY